MVRDHEVPVGQRGGHIHLGGRRRLESPVHRLAGAQQRLGRDAGPVGALTTNQLALDHSDPQATFRKGAGAVLAGSTAAQDDHVVVAFHGLLLSGMKPRH